MDKINATLDRWLDADRQRETTRIIKQLLAEIQEKAGYTAECADPESREEADTYAADIVAKADAIESLLP